MKTISIGRAGMVLFGLMILTAAGAPARAGYFTIDDPNPTVVSPTSGTYTYTFTGSVSFDLGFFYNGEQVFNLFDAAGDGLSLDYSSATNYFSSAANGGVYSGPLLSFTIDPSTPLGVYDMNPVMSPPVVNIYEQNASGEFRTLTASLSATIVSAVPEPSSLTLCGLAGLIGLVIARPGLGRTA